MNNFSTKKLRHQINKQAVTGWNSASVAIQCAFNLLLYCIVFLLVATANFLLRVQSEVLDYRTTREAHGLQDSTETHSTILPDTLDITSTRLLG